MEYDPDVISYDDLLEIFWKGHNPLHRSYSTQYKAAVFASTEEERKRALESRAAIAKRLGSEVQTDVVPANTFTPAEDYHQKYYLRNQPPLWKVLAQAVGGEDALMKSALGTRANAYVGGHCEVEAVLEEVRKLDIPAEEKARLEALLD